MKLYPADWKVRMIYGTTATACMTAVVFFGRQLGIQGFWPSILAIVGAILFGNLVLGPFVVRLIRPS